MRMDQKIKPEAEPRKGHSEGHSHRVTFIKVFCKIDILVPAVNKNFAVIYFGNVPKSGITQVQRHQQRNGRRFRSDDSSENFIIT